MLNRQVVYDVMQLRVSEFNKMQRELDVTFHQGAHESLVDFRKRVLTEIDREGKIRQLEQFMTQ